MNQPLITEFGGKATRRRGFAGSGFEKPAGWLLGWSSCFNPRRSEGCTQGLLFRV